jgi:hypothetical protein
MVSLGLLLLVLTMIVVSWSVTYRVDAARFAEKVFSSSF